MCTRPLGFFFLSCLATFGVWPLRKIPINFPKIRLQGEEFERNLEKVRKLKNIAEAKGTETAHIVLAWYLARPEIDGVIPGAKRADQVLSNLSALDVQLSTEEILEIGSIFKD